MKGLIINNAYYETPSTRYQGERLFDEFSKLGVRTDIVKNDFFGAAICNGRLENTAAGYDFAVYFDKDKYLSYALEKLGVRLFNSHGAIQACDDKAVTFLKLADSGIPMPDTIPGLLCYDPSADVLPQVYGVLERRLGYPMVIKECYGSLGKFVYKVENREELQKKCRELICTPHLFQKFIEESAGRDIRVVCIGGRAEAAMQRTSQTDFRSNIELGGRGTPYEIDGELRRLCERTAELLGLDYCGIDVLFGKDGYLLCEVNSNAFFGGIERATGANIAKLYAEHIIATVNKQSPRKNG